MSSMLSPSSINPLSKKAAVREVSDLVMNNDQSSGVFAASPSMNHHHVSSPNTGRNVVVKASSAADNNDGDNNMKSNSSPHQSSSSSSPKKKSSSSTSTNKTTTSSAFYLNDPARRAKTCYAFFTCVLPTCCAIVLCLTITAPDWFRSEDFKYKKDGDYLSRYFEIPDRSFAAVSPLSPNSTCIPLYEPSVASLARNEYLQFLADRSIGTTTGTASSSSSSSSLSGGSSSVTADGGAGDATAAARAIVAVSPFGCRDLGDAVTGVSWMHLALVGVLFGNTCLSIFELASRGPYGGDRSTARTSFILQLVAFAVSLIIIIGWYLTKQVTFCDKQSLAQRGFDYGWPFYSAAALALAILLDLIHSGAAISRVSRGPPSMSIIYRTMTSCWAAIGVFAQGHLRHTVIPSLTLTGYAEACLEFEIAFPCSSEMKLYSMLLLGGIALAIFVAVLLVFFVAARAIDHRGRTLKHSAVTGFILMLGSIGLMVAIFALASIDGKTCDVNDIPSIWTSGFFLGVGSWLIAPFAVFSLAFFIMNVMYLCSCTERSEYVNLETGQKRSKLPEETTSSSPRRARNNGNNINNNNTNNTSTNKRNEDDDLGGLLASYTDLPPTMTHANIKPQQKSRTANTLEQLKQRMRSKSAHHQIDQHLGNNDNNKQSSSNENNSNNTTGKNTVVATSSSGDIVLGADGCRYLVRKKSMYHWFWWDSLVDARSASILEREVADADEHGNVEQEEKDQKEREAKLKESEGNMIEMNKKLEGMTKTDENGNEVREPSPSPPLVGDRLNN